MRLPDDCDIELGYYRGPLEHILAGLRDADLTGAFLELDGAGSPALDAFIERRTRDHPELAAHNQRARESRRTLGPFTWGGFGSWRIPADPGTLSDLLALAEQHAESEIAVELTVYDSGGGARLEGETADMARVLDPPDLV